MNYKRCTGIFSPICVFSKPLFSSCPVIALTVSGEILPRTAVSTKVSVLTADFFAVGVAFLVEVDGFDAVAAGFFAVVVVFAAVAFFAGVPVAFCAVGAAAVVATNSGAMFLSLDSTVFQSALLLFL